VISDGPPRPTLGRGLYVKAAAKTVLKCSRSTRIAGGSRTNRTLPSHHRSAVKEAAADGKEAVEKSDTARSENSFAVA
jgi:hypothetical protein